MIISGLDADCGICHVFETVLAMNNSILFASTDAYPIASARSGKIHIYKCNVVDFRLRGENQG